MPVAAPQDGYTKMISYAQKKVLLRPDQLALQSVLAGLWIAIYGHACTVFASYFYDSSAYSSGLTKLAYGMLFPGAFVAVVYTGTELFTGNTVTMIMYLMENGKKALVPLLRIWSYSFIGNFTGAVGGAFLLSYCSGVFREGREQDFLFHLADGKIGRNFGANVVLGFGCNALVCLATWCVVCSDDGAGKILAIFYSVGVFAMGGYEHVIANFYTLSAATMVGYINFSFVEIIYRNWIPVLIGNLIAGTIFTGVMWWYTLHPAYTDLAPYSDAELLRELTARRNTLNDFGEMSGMPRWKRETSGSFLVPMVPPKRDLNGPVIVNPPTANSYPPTTST